MIEVVNLSSFPVIINTVGFKTQEKDGDELVLASIKTKDNFSWPRKLESREKVSLYFSLSELINNHEMLKVKKVFARTSCGVTFTGNSNSLKKLVNFLKKKITTY